MGDVFVKINFKNMIIFIILFFVEIIIGLFIHDNIIRPYFGDILVVGVIYFFLRIFIVKLRFLNLYVFIFACLVEFMQYLNVAVILHIENFRLAKIILGSTFDFKDIFCYFIGTMLIFLYERVDTNFIKKKVSGIK